MIDLDNLKDKPPFYIHAEIVSLSRKIVEARRKALKDGLKSVGEAIDLQALERDRKQLQALLPPLRLVSDNPNPVQLCEDEGCPNFGNPHVCIVTVEKGE